MTTHLRQESCTNELDLSAEDPSTVKVLLQYLYQDDYTRGTDMTKLMLLEARLYALARYCNIEKLAKLVCVNFNTHIQKDRPKAIFPEVVKAIYNSTPASDRSLRDVVVDLSISHHAEIFTSQMMEGVDSFGLDCFKKLRYENKKVHDWAIGFVCLKCSGKWFTAPLYEFCPFCKAGSKDHCEED
ncbi:hypothetical protein AOQ84DRAFT_365424 [Glonium stellatum]|uniref:BTB domain-containing protein n=1 Tax=Glonium stellatum TaxID=574774 RepID=A0A8E2JRW3_9PEZI|nr:hypothetical protein AOQ84DRAFT_365424 [Glonium stellatum]